MLLRKLSGQKPVLILNKFCFSVSTEMHLVSESLTNVDDMKLSFENTARSGDELTLDFDASICDSDFNLYPAKPSHRLRRKSTELYRLSQNNQQSLATLEEMPEQQESAASQIAQNGRK